MTVRSPGGFARLLECQLAAATFAATTAAAAPGTASEATIPPVSISQAAPVRHALIIAAASLGGATPARSAVAQADATRYRDLLRLLGFEVTIVRSDTRPELKTGVDGFARQINANTEVAVFVLGGILPKGDELYIVATDRRPDPASYETEGLRIRDLMRGIADRGPKENVLFIDECHAAAGQACHVTATTVPENVSAIVGLREDANPAGTPLAGLASLRSEMLPLMQSAGTPFLDVFSKLKSSLAGTNMSVAATPSLTRSFVFLPQDFFAQLPNACNRVDLDARAETLKDGAPVEPLVGVCTTAAATYAFSAYFKDRLEAVREQDAFQKAASGCDASAARAYRDAYPNGRFVSALGEITASCEAAKRRAAAPPPPPPPPPEPAPTPPAPQAQPTSVTCTVVGLDPNGDNWLALRDAPSRRSSWSTTRMGPGTQMTAMERDGPWVHVRLASGESGWANGRFLACSGSTPPQPPSQPASCRVDGLDPAGNNWLALRFAPSFQSSWSQTRMGPGTPLTVLERSGPWMHVRLRTGETGWANGQFVRCSE